MWKQSILKKFPKIPLRPYSFHLFGNARAHICYILIGKKHGFSFRYRTALPINRIMFEYYLLYFSWERLYYISEIEYFTCLTLLLFRIMCLNTSPKATTERTAHLIFLRALPICYIFIKSSLQPASNEATVDDTFAMHQPIRMARRCTIADCWLQLRCRYCCFRFDIIGLWGARQFSLIGLLYFHMRFRALLFYIHTRDSGHAGLSMPRLCYRLANWIYFYITWMQIFSSFYHWCFSASIRIITRCSAIQSLSSTVWSSSAASPGHILMTFSLLIRHCHHGDEFNFRFLSALIYG